MTVEELIDLFEKIIEEPFGDNMFKNIENPLHPRSDICAFMLLHDLVGGTGDMVVAAEHDEIFLDVELGDLASVITPDQVRTLVRCGLHVDEDHEGLSMFV